jgi:hypothetical protein
VYPPDPSDLDVLRALCERESVSPTDEDLAAVQGFLRAILPALAELERMLPEEIGSVP